MVAARSFLIDATFLLEDAEGAFLGAAAIVDSHGRNNSIVYGAVRDMLRLRGTLGIVSGVIVVGAEATTVVSPAPSGNPTNETTCRRLDWSSSAIGTMLAVFFKKQSRIEKKNRAKSFADYNRIEANGSATLLVFAKKRQLGRTDPAMRCGVKPRAYCSTPASGSQ